MIVVRNGEVLAPEPLGRTDVVIAGGRIEAIRKIDLETLRSQLDCEVVDAEGCVVTPGIIDVHLHLTGGSGESGWGTQTPTIYASELIASGVTTAVGALGTDTTTKSMPGLIAAVKGLRAEGLNAYAWTGGYDARPMTASMRDDLILIDEIIGAGEIAIADRRGVHLDARELARLATDCYVAGTITGKGGVLHLHVGEAEEKLAVLREVLDRFPVNADVLYPTHVERNEALMSEAIDLARRGCPIDVDVYERDLAKWVRFWLDANADLSLLTASSDAAIKSPRNLLSQTLGLVRDDVLRLQDALRLVTSNPARILKLSREGRIASGARANLLVLDRDSLELSHVIANGELVMRDGHVLLREKFLRESDRNIALKGAHADA